jgi:hypothetical protein
VVTASVVGTRAGAAVAVAPNLPAWTGGVSLYRRGTFTTQKSWLWCTAAGVQIVRNIVKRTQDHSIGGQRTYFEWMRKRNRYALPRSAGVDPAGWTAGLRHFVDDRYRLVASKTFDAALRSAVKNLRLTGLPVALTVSHGGHGWILTGFAATADPAVTNAFRVTSVRVVGPLYGLQSKNGYDMAPNKKLTPTQLKRFFTGWRYAPKRMVWDGKFVSIQPIPVGAAAAPVGAAAGPAVASAGPGPAGASPTTAATATASSSPRPTGTPAASALAVAVASATPRTPATIPASERSPGQGISVLAATAIALAALAVIGAASAGIVRERRRPTG